ncbi:hypothetical protein J1N35_014459 [Gossypium stocksii]|uniref:Uncharacterized protein n=1 Tax=Gossypium stocksii TaxID=47602 RepID=A0A9D3VVE6_9ROSI|nr:hypothetical protein J1N35_014459 [Gossypium stocksii]
MTSKHFLPSPLLPQALSPKHFSTPSKCLIPSISSKPIPKNHSFSLKTNVFSSLPSPNVSSSSPIDEPAPGLKAIFGFRVSDQRFGKIELQYLHEYAEISSSIGLTANPIVNFSSVLGTNVLALSTDILFDTKTENFTKCNAGLSFTNIDLITCLALHVVMNEKDDSINASYYHIVNPLTNIVVGAKVTQSFSTNVNTITVGTQHALDPLTTIKAQVNNTGKASTLIQHEWISKSHFTISGEEDTESIDKSPKVELALALKP